MFTTLFCIFAFILALVVFTKVIPQVGTAAIPDTAKDTSRAVIPAAKGSTEWVCCLRAGRPSDGNVGGRQPLAHHTQDAFK
jgi:hypothetical protein